jgi:signal transduction histidine kinase
VRLEGRQGELGFFVVGMSTAQIGSVLATLLVIQGVLAPLALLGLFMSATVIGRRAAAPIEQARLRQLEFTADASHELRTPLSVIEAEVSLALGVPRSASEYRGTLERVASESQRLRRIVQDLLWLARLDALPDGPPHEPIDVSTVAESCVERFRGVAANRGISLFLNESVGPAPMVVAPGEWLDQLVGVLLDNACRHANEGGRVEVDVGATDDEVRLRVDDDGPGFDTLGREVALQRFHRASENSGGAGLGLAIAQAVVRATGGRIFLGDAELGGARVVITWPRSQGKTGGGAAHRRGDVRARFP